MFQGTSQRNKHRRRNVRSSTSPNKGPLKYIVANIVFITASEDHKNEAKKRARTRYLENTISQRIRQPSLQKFLIYDLQQASE